MYTQFMEIIYVTLIQDVLSKKKDCIFKGYEEIYFSLLNNGR